MLSSSLSKENPDGPYVGYSGGGQKLSAVLYEDAIVCQVSYCSSFPTLPQLSQTTLAIL